MKKHFFYFLALFLISADSAFAQNEIVVGDMDNSGDLTIGDITQLSETIIGRLAPRYATVAGRPYESSNSEIVGLWQGSSKQIRFNVDGTTDYKSGYTYKYFPGQALVVFYNNEQAEECLEVIKLTKTELVLADPSLTTFQTYNNKIILEDDGSLSTSRFLYTTSSDVNSCDFEALWNASEMYLNMDLDVISVSFSPKGVKYIAFPSLLKPIGGYMGYSPYYLGTSLSTPIKNITINSMPFDVFEWTHGEWGPFIIEFQKKSF